jgi:hypothetical protein
LALVVGCDSAEDQCETLCEWVDKCSGLDANCSDSNIEDCAEDVDDLDGDCEDAFDAFVDCLEEQDNDCDDVARSCQGEAAEFDEQCEDQI